MERILLTVVRGCCSVDGLLQTVTERYRNAVIDLRPSQPLKKAVSQWEDEVPAQLRSS